MPTVTKQESAILALIPISIYIATYVMWIAGNPSWVQLSCIFGIGTFLLFTLKIEPGCRGELLWNDKATGYFWEDGLCLMFTIFPLLHAIGIHPFFWIKKDYRENLHLHDARPVTIHHNQDDFTHRTYSQVSFGKGNFYRILSKITKGIWGWFTGFGIGHPDLIYQRIGWRIMVLAILAGFAVRVPAKTEELYKETLTAIERVVQAPLATQQQQTEKSVTTLPTEPSLISQDGAIPLTDFEKEVSLGYDKRHFLKQTFVRTNYCDPNKEPQLPTKEHFVPSTDPDKLEYIVVKNRRYFLYPEPKPGTVPLISNNLKSACLLVPPGRKIAFLAQHRPTCVDNFKRFAFAQKKWEHYSSLEQFFLWQDKKLTGRKELPLPILWSTIRDEWHTIKENTPIIVTAFEKEDLEPGNDGAMICF